MLHDTKTGLALSITLEEELPVLYEFQTDPLANHLAAFTSKESADRNKYIERYSKFLVDPSIHMRTIKVNGEIVGSIAKYVMNGDAEITYWVDRKHWGKGIASAALHEFLKLETSRPLYGRTAFDNYGSQRVLEKNGFSKTGSDKGFANARQTEIEEFIFLLK